MYRGFNLDEFMLSLLCNHLGSEVTDWPLEYLHMAFEVT